MTLNNYIYNTTKKHFNNRLTEQNKLLNYYMAKRN